jgi:hypothetical protein
VVLDYAHTPDAIARLCATARRIAGAGRVLLVFGAGGEVDVEKREPMGEAAARGADVVFIANDNPRREDPAAIVAALERGARRGTADVRVSSTGPTRSDTPSTRAARTTCAGRGARARSRHDVRKRRGAVLRSEVIARLLAGRGPGERRGGTGPALPAYPAYAAFDAAGNRVVWVPRRAVPRDAAAARALLGASPDPHAEILAVLGPEAPRPRAWFYNPDGSPERLCGNALRCLPRSSARTGAAGAGVDGARRRGVVARRPRARLGGDPTGSARGQRARRLPPRDVGTPHRVACVADVTAPR